MEPFTAPLFTHPGHRVTQRRATTGTRPWQVSDRNSGRIPGAAVIPLWALLWMLKRLAEIPAQSSPSPAALRDKAWVLGENAAFDLRKSFNGQVNGEAEGQERCGGAEGKDSSHQGFLCCWTGQAGYTYTHIHTHTEVSPFPLHKRSSAAVELLRIVSKEKWNTFLMVNHKRTLLHPVSYGL